MAGTRAFRWLAVPALAFALATGSEAAAQDPDRLARARAALPAEAAVAFDREIDAARTRGIPADPLVDKALEGVAKNVPPERIVSVVRQLARDLDRARGLLRAQGEPPPQDADIAAVADALGRGTPESAVRSLRGQAPPDEPIALAVHTLGDLLDRGVPVNVALDVLGAWRGGGAALAELPELPAAVERLMRQGALPADAAAAVASAVRAGRPPAALGIPPGRLPVRPSPGPRRGPPDS